MTRQVKAKSSLRAITGAFALITLSAAAAYAASGAHIEVERQSWTFGGISGQYDKAQLQRGFRVFQEKCSSCHSLNRVAFRSLAQPGGPEFVEDSVKMLAKDWPYKLPTNKKDEDGETVMRDLLASDPIIGPDEESLAAWAATPPDLSLMTKARTVENHSSWPLHVLQMGKDMLTGHQENGPDYVYALLKSYVEKEDLADGMYYNKSFPGHQIAMPPPLASDNTVAYIEEGETAPEGMTVPPATLEQNAKDVTAFLAWAADPHLNSRKQMGWQVMVYLLITTILLYLGKRSLWARIEH